MKYIYLVIKISLLGAFFVWIHYMEMRNQEMQRNRRDRELINGYSRMSTPQEVQDAYNRQSPVIDHNAYVVDGDTLATENI